MSTETPGEGALSLGAHGSPEMSPLVLFISLPPPSTSLLLFLSGLSPREPLHKQFLSEENMATHFSRLSLHNDHPYCSPPVTFPQVLPPLRSSCPELLLWRYPGSLIPEALRLLRLGDTPSPFYPASPAGDIMEL